MRNKQHRLELKDNIVKNWLKLRGDKIIFRGIAPFTSPKNPCSMPIIIQVTYLSLYCIVYTMLGVWAKVSQPEINNVWIPWPVALTDNLYIYIPVIYYI